MLSISRSERFKKDYENYKTAIDQIEDSQTKTELNRLLVDLVNEVKSIDQYYENLAIGSDMPSRIDDSRSSITSIRKELDRRLSLKS